MNLDAEKLSTLQDSATVTNSTLYLRKMKQGALREADAVRWETNLGEPNKFEAVSLVVCPNAVLAVVRNQQKFRSQPQWYLVALEAKSGRQLFKRELRGDPLPGGLLVDRDGRIVVTLLDGRVLGFGQ